MLFAGVWHCSSAKESGLSQNAIVRIWHTFGLQPHRVENFKLSTAPQFVEKVRDIVRSFLRAPERVVVLCVDDKSTALPQCLRPAKRTKGTRFVTEKVNP